MTKNIFKKSLLYTMSAASLLSSFGAVGTSLVATVHADQVSGATDDTKQDTQAKLKVVVAQGETTLNVKSFVSNYTALPNGTKVVLDDTADQETMNVAEPADGKSEFHNVNLKVVYPDGKSEHLSAVLKAVSKNYVPEFNKTVTLTEKGQTDPYSVIKDGAEGVPEGAKVAWDVPAQVDTDAKKPGTYAWTYTYTKADGTAVKGTVEAKVTSNGTEKLPDNSNQGTVNPGNGSETTKPGENTPADQKPADKDVAALKSAVDQEATVKASTAYKNATPEKKKAYDDALEAAKRVQADKNATAKQVKDATDALNKAQSDLSAPVAESVDKTQLNQAITDAKSVQETTAYRDGNKDKKDALDAALKTAQDVSGNKDATKEQVANALQALKTAMDALKTTDNDPASTASKTALQAAIDKANKAIQDKTLNGKALTDEQISNLKNAVANAQKVLDNANATEKEVNDATKALNAELANPDIKVEDTTKADANKNTDKKSENGNGEIKPVTGSKSGKSGKVAKDSKSYPDSASYPDKASYPSRLPQTGENVQSAALGLTGVVMLGLTALGATKLKKRD